MSSSSQSAGSGRCVVFATTRWSVVLAAAETGGASGDAGTALAELCRLYWFPLYAFVRRRGHSPHDAEDLTQAFFVRFLEKNGLAAVNPDKGRFRSFLLASLKHFLANEWDRGQAQKRGGGESVLELDALTAEERYRLEPADALSPERLYERQWALSLLAQVLDRLEAEHAAAGKGVRFAEMKGFLTGEGTPDSYSTIGGRHGLSEGAFKVAVHRLRKRYRELLREEIARTVADPAETADELRRLFAAFQI